MAEDGYGDTRKCFICKELLSLFENLPVFSYCWCPSPYHYDLAELIVILRQNKKRKEQIYGVKDWNMNIQRKFSPLRSLPLYCCFHLRNTRTKHVHACLIPCTLPFTCQSLRLALVERADNERSKEGMGLYIVEGYDVAVRLSVYIVKLH